MSRSSVSARYSSCSNTKAKRTIVSHKQFGHATRPSYLSAAVLPLSAVCPARSENEVSFLQGIGHDRHLLADLWRCLSGSDARIGHFLGCHESLQSQGELICSMFNLDHLVTDHPNRRRSRQNPLDLLRRYETVIKKIWFRGP